jgi:predicted metal-dependent hydrolase
VAFDLYQAVDGNHRWRVRWYLYVCVIFAFDASRQTLLNLYRDGSWWRPGTWLSATRFFFGREGIFWRTLPAMLRYLRRDFHPDHEHHSPPAAVLAQCWLAANTGRFQVVGRGDEAMTTMVKTEAVPA